MEDYVYHYTTLEALKGIIREDGICLWATKYDCLNDPLEQRWAQQVVLNEIGEMEEYSVMDKKEIAAFHSKYPYTISLCTDCDSRVMWRLYANDGNGVMLVLKTRILSETARAHTVSNPKDRYEIFAPVVYANENNIEKCIKESLEKSVYPELDDPENNKARACSFIKHEDFRCENEVRYAVSRDVEKLVFSYNSTQNKAELTGFEENTKGVKYRMRGNEIVPYMEVHLPIDSLEKVVVGYQMKNPNVVCQYIKDYMRTKNEKLYKDIKVEESGIKYNI